MLKEKQSHDIAAYAGYLKNNAELLQCSSGGIATALARKMISLGGFVAGVAYSDDFKEAKYEIVNNESDLDKFKGSKYISVNKNAVYTKVQSLLNDGKAVLFFGTPCIVAALRSFLKTDYENLLTVELICHGPTDPKVHRQFVEYLENRYKSRIVDFSVKKKKDRWTPQYLYARFENGSIYEENFYHTEYGYAFSAMGMPSCYSCQFRGSNRTGDIMIGDFWGADSSDEFWNELGVSSILIHTEKGEAFLKSLDDVQLFPTTFERIAEKNQNILKPRASTAATEKFTKLFADHDLFYSVKHSRSKKAKIKAFFKSFFPKALLKRLKAKSQ